MLNSLKQKQLEEEALVTKRKVYHGRVFSVEEEHLTFDSLRDHKWEMVTHSGAVAILPVLASGEVILIQQWRRPVGKILYEIPAGTLDKNEDPKEAALRELQEEIGFYPRKLIPFGGFYSAPGFCTEYIHLYIGKELKEQSLPQDDHEAIDTAVLSLEDALGLIDNGEIEDAKTLTALLRYAREDRHA